MKLLKLLFVIAFFSAFTACNNDDDDAATLVGTWKVTSIDYQGTTTSTGGGQTFSGTFTGVGSDLDMTVEFKDNGDYTSSGNYTITLTTEFNGQTVTNTSTETGFMGNGTWVQVGDVITTTDSSGETGSATIVSIDGNQMTLEVDETETEVDQGITTTFDINATYIFEKQ